LKIQEEQVAISRILLVALALSVALAVSCEKAGDEGDRQEAISSEEFPRPAEGITRKVYHCQRLRGEPVIDGRINEEEWKGAVWSDDFVDISGSVEYPPLRTQVRMAWDDTYFFVAARLEEPDVWATLTEHDAVIWQDDDFEVFIDPDGDTHEYYELEINALGTVFDLFLVKPYRDGGPAVHYWDIDGLKKAVSVEGTLNDPSDRDTGWEVELAIPWKVLAECANCAAPPSEGDIWRINFSRVEWKAVVEGGRYVKATDPETGKPFAESNWTWSPQGIINMHYPEMWGYVLFTNAARAYGGMLFEPGPDEEAWDALRDLYYAEQTWMLRHGEYTADLGALGLGRRDIFGHQWPPVLEATRDRFEARLYMTDGSGAKQIVEDGRTRIVE
jgi:hypothetical protein